MKKQKMVRILLGIVLCSIFFTISSVGNAAGQEKGQKISLSVLDFMIGERDRIGEFKVRILYGFVVSVPRIPPGWFFRVDLPYQWKTNVIAGAVVGVAYLTADESRYFNDFLILEYTGHKDEPLDIEVEIKVDTYAEGTKTFRFNMDKLRLKKIE